MQPLIKTLTAMTGEWLQVLTRMVHNKHGISKHDGGSVRPQTHPNCIATGVAVAKAGFEDKEPLGLVHAT